MTASLEVLEMIVLESCLAASVVEDNLIMSVGQEKGPEYDLIQDSDIVTEKTFSHEWDSSSTDSNE